MTAQKGFTLIELLITISIIAILSAIGMIAYSTVLKQGRDSKRQADLRTIQSALEQYHSDNGSYPTNLDALTTGQKYLTTIPSDPITANYRAYRYGPWGTGYRLCALFEIDPTPDPMTDPSGCSEAPPNNINCAGGEHCNGGVSPP